MKINNIFIASKYTIMVAVVAALIGQLLMLLIGATKVYEAVKLYLLKEDISGYPEHIFHSDIATALLIQAVDAFLIAVVLMYFAFSLFHLFLGSNPDATVKLFPGNIAPRDIRELKETLAEVVIVVLFILFLQQLWMELNNLRWELLVAPVSIALLALSMKWVNFGRR